MRKNLATLHEIRDRGGYGLIHLRDMSEALRKGWLPYLLNKDNSDLFRIMMERECDRGENINALVSSRSSPKKYWRDIIGSWEQMHFHFDHTPGQLIRQYDYYDRLDDPVTVVDDPIVLTDSMSRMYKSRTNAI